MITSANTSINKTKVPKLFTLVTKEFGWRCRNLDIGGGKYNTATKYLKRLGTENFIYDPYNRTKEHNDAVLAALSHVFADTATLSNVLNVIKDKKDRVVLLKLAKKYLKGFGHLYITCYNSGKKGMSKKDCWQNAEPLDFYIREIIEVFGNVQRKGNMLYAVKH